MQSPPLKQRQNGPFTLDESFFIVDEGKNRQEAVLADLGDGPCVEENPKVPGVTNVLTPFTG